MPDDDIEEIGKFPITDFLYEEGYEPLETPFKLEKIVKGHRGLMSRLLIELNGYV